MDVSAAFVERLATASPATRHVFNQYAGGSAVAAACRGNLEKYLDMMKHHSPRLLLVGEAPGYRGCRLTGIPFTSPQVLATQRCFGAANGFQGSPNSASMQREASATIVWQTMAELNIMALLWNVFPFHPQRPGEPAGNRPPSAAEVRAGEPFTRDLLAAFAVVTVVAVGKKAEAALALWGIDAVSVRHPAHGGSAQFRRQMAEIVNERASSTGIAT